ncbi:E1 ubiquitin-activating protein [Saccharomycopsis crataegensis]|uniref:E1 ubiquitin-activating protein n=1 Tax=Saccharomycopsis crataegensis TaxID=43959 RepID=A0AAV5QI10_9ASCO|nr:E1 ubiquitin-activating protein [Saccharomycopsis crataegensis]
MSAPKELSNEEIALYDRQIRLWGLEAQRKIKTAHILLINLSAVGTEIAKNLVLGGVGSLSIIDNHDITEADFSGQYYISEDDCGKKRVESAQERIQDLNPRVDLNVFTDDINTKEPEWFSQFNLVISTELAKESILRINNVTRQLNIPFYATGLNGLSGYVFLDLIEHTATYKKEKSNISTKTGKVFSFSEIVSVESFTENNQPFENVTTKDHYKSFKQFLENFNKQSENIKETYTTKRKLKRISPILPLTLASLDFNQANKLTIDSLKSKAVKICENLSIPSTVLENKDQLIESFIAQQNHEFAPVSAIIGGVLAQDVINVLGNKNKPINNFIVLDGLSGEMPIFTI